MINEAATFKAQDEVTMQRVQAKSQLESYCLSMREALKSLPPDSKEAEAANTLMKQTMEWFDKQDENVTTKEMYENKLKELQGICEPLLSAAAAASSASGAGAAASASGAAPEAGPTNPFFNAQGPPGSAAAPPGAAAGPKVEEMD